MENLESPSPSAIDDLIQDRMDGVPSSTTDTAQDQSPEPVTSQAAQAPTEQEPSPEPSPVAAQPNEQVQAPPTPQTIRIGDRDYTAQELQAALTSAQQLPHLQNKYVGLLENLKQSQQPNQGQPQGQQRPQMAPQQVLQAVRNQYDPQVQELVKQGLIEQDFAALFPGMAAQMLYYRDGFNQVGQVLQGVIGELNSSRQQQESTGFVNDVGRSISQLAMSGDAFAPLKDPQEVQKFFNYLWDLNPQVGHLRNPDFLARQWVAYNKDQYLQTAQTRAAADARQQQVRYATADATTGSRPPGVMQEPQKTPLEQMTEDFFQRSL